MDSVFGGPPAREAGSSGEATARDAQGTQGLAALARELRERERRALLEREGPLHETIRADTAELRAALEELAVRALADGHTLAGLSAAALPSSDARARFEAMGRLAATCARTAEVEEVLLEEARALGGEMPADRNAHLRRARSRARFDLHSAVRGAVLRGVAPAAIVEITQAAGLDMEEGDLVLAFEVRVEH
jgi:hypothetical protein